IVAWCTVGSGRFPYLLEQNVPPPKADGWTIGLTNASLIWNVGSVHEIVIGWDVVAEVMPASGSVKPVDPGPALGTNRSMKSVGVPVGSGFAASGLSSVVTIVWGPPAIGVMLNWNCVPTASGAPVSANPALVGELKRSTDVELLLNVVEPFACRQVAVGNGPSGPVFTTLTKYGWAMPSFPGVSHGVVSTVPAGT